MFAFVEGIIDDLDYENCIIDIGGFGVNVGISARTAAQLPGIGEHAKLYTYTSVREDDISLYGFLSRDDLDMFRRLISVSGVGPKSALGILSELDADSVRFAVLSGDAKTLSKAPGVGAKTAQRIVLELKDKVKLSDESMVAHMMTGTEKAATDKALTLSQQDAISALVALGYSQTESRKAVLAAAVDANADSGEILSAALKTMF
jgi:Holliday junction DNA helicase RuvA